LGLPRRLFAAPSAPEPSIFHRSVSLTGIKLRWILRLTPPMRLAIVVVAVAVAAAIVSVGAGSFGEALLAVGIAIWFVLPIVGDKLRSGGSDLRFLAVLNALIAWAFVPVFLLLAIREAKWVYVGFLVAAACVWFVCAVLETFPIGNRWATPILMVCAPIVLVVSLIPIVAMVSVVI